MNDTGQRPGTNLGKGPDVFFLPQAASVGRYLYLISQAGQIWNQGPGLATPGICDDNGFHFLSSTDGHGNKYYPSGWFQPTAPDNRGADVPGSLHHYNPPRRGPAHPVHR